MTIYFDSRHAKRASKYQKAGLWGDQTLHGLLERNARLAPEREAVVDQPNKEELIGSPARRLTMAQLERASSVCANTLKARGITAGDTVILQLPNTSELIVLYYALSKLGAVISPIAVQYGAHEISHFATELNPTAFITVDYLRGEPLAAQASQTLPNVPVWSVTKDLDVFAGADTETDLLKRTEWSRDAEQLLTVAWTSGTTGTPKGVPRTQNMWIAQGQLTSHAAQFKDGERLLSPFPMINMAALGGFLFPSALHCCTLVLHHPMDIPLYLKQLQDEAVNFTLAPPPLLNRLAQQPEMWKQFDFSFLRLIGSGSVPLSPAMIDIFENQFNKPIINFYGSNEGVGLISTPENSPSPEQRASLFPRMGIEGLEFESYAPDVMLTRVINPDTGAEISQAGVPGELVVDGPGVFNGYLNHDGEGVFTEDGYFRSGDLVEISNDYPSHYQIVGRCKDIINRGGVKLSPSEIDSQLEGMPGLAEAAVCAIADDDLGEKVCACVVPIEGEQAPSLDDIKAFLSEKGMARFKLPESRVVMAALPRNPLGKVVREALRAQVESESK